MQSAAARFGFVVAGYSGRDASVMALFHEALAQPNPFPGGLLWTTITGGTVLPAVAELLAAAGARGVAAHLVAIDTFDALMLRLWRNLPDKPATLDAKVRRFASVTVNVAVPSAGTAKPLLRLNAIPIRALPAKCLAVRVKRPMEWADLRQLQKDAETRLVFTKGSEIWCWGPRSEVMEAFGDNLVEIAERELPVDITLAENFHIKGFLLDAIASALAKQRPLLARTQRTSAFLIADPHSEDKSLLEPVFQVVGKLSGNVAGLFAPVTDLHTQPVNISWAEAVRISITQKQGATWLLVDPDIWIWPPRARDISQGILDERRKGRFNDKYNELLSAWVQVLIGSRENGLTSQFVPSMTPMMPPILALLSEVKARLSRPSSDRPAFRGLRLFAASRARAGLSRWEARKHPLVGLIDNGPYGLRFGAPERLRIALVARTADVGRLRGLVGELARTAKPREALNYYPSIRGLVTIARSIAELADRTTFQLHPELDARPPLATRFASRKSCSNRSLSSIWYDFDFDVALVYLRRVGAPVSKARISTSTTI